MLRDTERVVRLLRHDRSTSVLHQYSDLATVRLGALRHLINDRLLDYRSAPNHRTNSLREL